MTDLLFLESGHPLQQVREELKVKLREAQENSAERSFSSAGDLCERVFQDLHVSAPIPKDLHQAPLSLVAEAQFGDLVTRFSGFLQAAKIPEASVPLLALGLAERLHLVRAFSDPDSVIVRVKEKVRGIVETFPARARDIECGRNPGDVLDPYILAATQNLLFSGDFDQAVAATVAHKSLMIIEGLMGHLHEDVIGMMRGNVRAPEPRGETVDPATNPFPGADVVQPPQAQGQRPRFHQIKSKTGSAKGGDGKRLGDQLQRLQDLYTGEIFYDALIGNTLRGHRSIAGVTAAAPGVVVLVGHAAFRELTRSEVGPQLLLRVYQAAFREVSAASGYSVETMAAGIVATFRARAESEGDTLLDVILSDVTQGPTEQQDSRHFRRGR